VRTLTFALEPKASQATATVAKVAAP